MPSLLSLGPPLNSPNLDLTFKTIAFIGTRLFTFPLVPMKGSRPIRLTDVVRRGLSAAITTVFDPRVARTKCFGFRRRYWTV